MLVGRDGEQRELDALLEGARDGRSAALVIRGAPGIGKTALLQYAAERADGMQVLRCMGIEAEHELPFAGLHQLVRPCLSLVDRLPAPQAAALKGALGLSADVVADRFLVSLGLLGLLAEAAEQAPVLCCIDDAQWLDRPSGEALLFAARRLDAEPVVVLLAAREGDARRFEAPGTPELSLQGLEEGAARELLSTRLEAAASSEVAELLLASAQGNPLALLELPAGLSERQLSGQEAIVGPPPVRGIVEEEFALRAARLPAPVRQLLVVAAADDTGDATTVERAAQRLGLAVSDLEAAAREGLVTVNAAVTFRHPLVRSAIYGSATREQRRSAHQALAEVVDDPVRSAWHRALVAEGADEGIAAELEAAASQATARGASITAAAAYERAAELSEDDERRGRRLRSAAQASLDAGRPDAAAAMAERARPLIANPLEVAQLTMVRAAEHGRRGSLAESFALMSEARRALTPVAPEVAQELAIWGLLGAFQGGWVARAVAEIEPAVAATDGGGELQKVVALLARGMALLAARDAGGARAPLTEARKLAEDLRPATGGFVPGPPRSGDSAARRAGTLVTVAGAVCFMTAEFARARRLIAQTVTEHREQGALMRVAAAMPALAYSQLGERRLREAATSVAEGLELTRQAGYVNDEAALLAVAARVAALHGREDECRQAAQAALQRALAAGIDWVANNARVALAELELGMGNPAETVARLEELTSAYIQPLAPLADPDAIDAALRLGERERALAALERLEQWAPVSGAPHVSELVGRCRGVLAEDPAQADGLFSETLDRSPNDVPPYERARTHLAYGERLRRDKRKVEARTHLRIALETFEGLGTEPWAERAQGELKATGERARKRDTSTLDDLTPQELRIAQLVAAGATNPEVASRLFVSTKTVEYHLRKVFQKVGVKSRVELARVPLGDAVAERDGEADL